MEIKNENRPWGSFRQFTNDNLSAVKIIKVKAGARLSLQYHEKRDEFWLVMSGHPVITIGEETKMVSPGDEFFITKKMKHRIAGSQDDVEILEIAYGDFDEDDIVRIEDDFGRV